MEYNKRGKICILNDYSLVSVTGLPDGTKTSSKIINTTLPGKRPVVVSGLWDCDSNKFINDKFSLIENTGILYKFNPLGYNGTPSNRVSFEAYSPDLANAWGQTELAKVSGGGLYVCGFMNDTNIAKWITLRDGFVKNFTDNSILGIIDERLRDIVGIYDSEEDIDYEYVMPIIRSCFSEEYSDESKYVYQTLLDVPDSMYVGNVSNAYLTVRNNPTSDPTNSEIFSAVYGRRDYSIRFYGFDNFVKNTQNEKYGIKFDVPNYTDWINSLAFLNNRGVPTNYDIAENKWNRPMITSYQFDGWTYNTSDMFNGTPLSDNEIVSGRTQMSSNGLTSLYPIIKSSTPLVFCINDRAIGFDVFSNQNPTDDLFGTLSDKNKYFKSIDVDNDEYEMWSLYPGELLTGPTLSTRRNVPIIGQLQSSRQFGRYLDDSFNKEFNGYLPDEYCKADMLRGEWINKDPLVIYLKAAPIKYIILDMENMDATVRLLTSEISNDKYSINGIEYSGGRFSNSSYKNAVRTYNDDLTFTYNQLNKDNNWCVAVGLLNGASLRGKTSDIFDIWYKDNVRFKNNSLFDVPDVITDDVVVRFDWSDMASYPQIRFTPMLNDETFSGDISLEFNDDMEDQEQVAGVGIHRVNSNTFSLYDTSYGVSNNDGVDVVIDFLDALNVKYSKSGYRLDRMYYIENGRKVYIEKGDNVVLEPNNVMDIYIDVVELKQITFHLLPGENNVSSYRDVLSENPDYYPLIRFEYENLDKEFVDISNDEDIYSLSDTISAETTSRYIDIDKNTGSAAIFLEWPDRDYYIFEGWYSDENYENIVNDGDAIYDGMNLYAKFDFHKAALRFHTGFGVDSEYFDTDYIYDVDPQGSRVTSDLSEIFYDMDNVPPQITNIRVKMPDGVLEYSIEEPKDRYDMYLSRITSGPKISNLVMRDLDKDIYDIYVGYKSHIGSVIYNNIHNIKTLDISIRTDFLYVSGITAYIIDDKDKFLNAHNTNAELDYNEMLSADVLSRNDYGYRTVLTGSNSVFAYKSCRRVVNAYIVFTYKSKIHLRLNGCLSVLTVSALNEHNFRINPNINVGYYIVENSDGYRIRDYYIEQNHEDEDELEFYLPSLRDDMVITSSEVSNDELYNSYAGTEVKFHDESEALEKDCVKWFEPLDDAYDDECYLTYDIGNGGSPDMVTKFSTYALDPRSIKTKEVVRLTSDFFGSTYYLLSRSSNMLDKHIDDIIKRREIKLSISDMINLYDNGDTVLYPIVEVMSICSNDKYASDGSLISALTAIGSSGNRVNLGVSSIHERISGSKNGIFTASNIVPRIIKCAPNHTISKYDETNTLSSIKFEHNPESYISIPEHASPVCSGTLAEMSSDVYYCASNRQQISTTGVGHILVRFDKSGYNPSSNSVKRIRIGSYYVSQVLPEIIIKPDGTSQTLSAGSKFYNAKFDVSYDIPILYYDGKSVSAFTGNSAVNNWCDGGYVLFKLYKIKDIGQEIGNSSFNSRGQITGNSNDTFAWVIDTSPANCGTEPFGYCLRTNMVKLDEIYDVVSELYSYNEYPVIERYLPSRTSFNMYISPDGNIYTDTIGYRSDYTGPELDKDIEPIMFGIR